jgi:hypothetical protein
MPIQVIKMDYFIDQIMVSFKAKMANVSNTTIKKIRQNYKHSQ